MITATAYFCGLAVLTYITTGLVCAAVRWFHMCRPYDRNRHYYYPGRLAATLVYLSSLGLLPVVFMPDNTDAWYLVKLFFLPVLLLYHVLLLFAYFGNIMRWRKWRKPSIVFSLPVILTALAAYDLALYPGIQIGDGALISHFTATLFLHLLGLAMTIACGYAVYRVQRWARSFNEDDFSNPSDFPVRFSRWMTALLVFDVVLLWSAAIVDNPVYTSAIILLMTLSQISLLLASLHPHRVREFPEQEEAAAVPVKTEEASLRKGYLQALSGSREAEILSAIRVVVEFKQAFLDPHLTLQDVADRCGYNRTYVSGIIKSHYEGFFKYINGLRMEFADNYRREHPDASVLEIASESGFGSRPSYYSVQKKLRNS